MDWTHVLALSVGTVLGLMMASCLAGMERHVRDAQEPARQKPTRVTLHGIDFDECSAEGQSAERAGSSDRDDRTEPGRRD